MKKGGNLDAIVFYVLAFLFVVFVSSYLIGIGFKLGLA